MNSFGETEAWAYPGTAHFSGTPYYLRNGKSYGFQVWPVHSEGPSEQNPLKILEKNERGSIQGLPNFFGYPLLSQEREKLLISNLASTFRSSIRIKAHENFWRKGSVGVSRDCPNFLGTPYYLRNGKIYGFQIWPVHSEGPSERKSIKNFAEKGAWAYPCRDCPIFFGHRRLSQERVKL